MFEFLRRSIVVRSRSRSTRLASCGPMRTSRGRCSPSTSIRRSMPLHATTSSSTARRTGSSRTSASLLGRGSPTSAVGPGLRTASGTQGRGRHRHRLLRQLVALRARSRPSRGASDRVRAGGLPRLRDGAPVRPHHDDHVRLLRPQSLSNARCCFASSAPSSPRNGEDSSRRLLADDVRRSGGDQPPTHRVSWTASGRRSPTMAF